MFSGIIDHSGELLSADYSTNSARLKIATQFPNLVPGESIAVDGVCLTVAAINEQSFEVDVSLETLQLTHFAQVQIGQLLNLERSLRLNDLLSGHMVMGHVDQVAQVKSIQEIEHTKIIEISGVKDEFKAYLIPKGSISVNGVSLTLNELTSDGFKLMLIPHTLLITNLKLLQAGSSVNLEFDIFAKTVFKQLSVLMPNLQRGES